MRLNKTVYGLLATLVIGALSQPEVKSHAAQPTVRIKDGTVIGSSSEGIDSFKGIPYAQAPTGTRRLTPPTPLARGFGTLFATNIPTACPQPPLFNTSNAPDLPALSLSLFQQHEFPAQPTDQGEDCLTIDVVRPSTATTESKLPVVYWIFGGAFEFGATSMYEGIPTVRKSINLGADVIYVAVNYRIAGWGFLAGREMQTQGATNLGLRDQRLGLEWVADNIAAFGGDPNRVTLWGESAGAISVYDHLLINKGKNGYNGKPLFSGAIMNSGSAVPAGDVASEKPQAIYDAVVAEAGCSSAEDTVACLRSLTYEEFRTAANSVPGLFSYRSLDLSYMPRPDPHDDFFPVSPGVAGRDGTGVALVPLIIGNQEDEGTLFATAISNVTDSDKLTTYLMTYFPGATKRQIDGLVKSYSADARVGSPFRTVHFNELYPGFKRNAAILGDLMFTLTRRTVLKLLQEIKPRRKAWSYLASYGYGTPFLGTSHGSDLYEYSTPGTPPHPQVQDTLFTYFISFINYQDPNKISTTDPLIFWPAWSTLKSHEPGKLLNLLPKQNVLISDDFRTANENYIKSIMNVLYV